MIICKTLTKPSFMTFPQDAYLARNLSQQKFLQLLHQQ